MPSNTAREKERVLKEEKECQSCIRWLNVDTHDAQNALHHGIVHEPALRLFEFVLMYVN